ncbi:protein STRICTOSIDINE SYNTHASE-LIKE 10-like [Silene latifolia]|uniref:protein STRICTOSIDINE SYNTHASE-LIKE 10-like n=1 Tax=Silene latifolia TaxID=37657 RepID=UPI003D775CE2
MLVSKYIVFTLKFISLMLLFNELVSVSGETKTYVKLPLGRNQTGPEAIAFDCNGEGPYVGISDGRVLKWKGPHIGWTTYAVTAPHRPNWCNGLVGSPLEEVCGRPLGLRFDMMTCELYVADSSFGLMKVSPEGGIASSLATIAEGVPFVFTNGLDVDFVNGIIYFTDTSTNYHRWEALEAINNRDQSGRFMKYDIKTREVTVLLRNLYFANGVALSKDNDFVLVAQTTTGEILKYWLTGYKAGCYEVLLQLDGRPDNINRDGKGDFWIAVRLSKSIKINHLGYILETIDGDEIINPSDVSEFDRRLWIGFVDQPYIYHTKMA